MSISKRDMSYELNLTLVLFLLYLYCLMNKNSSKIDFLYTSQLRNYNHNSNRLAPGQAYSIQCGLLFLF